MSASRISSRTEEQASLWAARLDGSTLSVADRQALDAWLAADPAHRPLLASYCQFSADLEQQLPLLAGVRDELAEMHTAPRTTSLFPWLRWPIWAGATLTAAAVVAVVFWLNHPRDEIRNVATPVAQRQEFTIDDGTHVELNAQTAIVVELSATERRVRLAGGEAFFHVKKDPQRPFFVETPAGSVRVTGTQFNVRTEAASALEVTVLEGSVQVRPGEGSEARSLIAGDQLVRDHNHVAVQSLSTAAMDDALAWRKGRVVFNGTPLREALTRFARYHGRSLNVSERAGNLRITTVFSLDDLKGFLDSLEEPGVFDVPVHVTRGTDGSIRVDTVHP